jgi:hypothetical protein
MKKIVFLFLLISGSILIKANGVFFWEYTSNGHRSCCLHIGNSDICNPDVPCTRTVQIDLVGIYDYIGRILAMEKVSTVPFFESLKNAQNYIKRGWGMSLSYRYDYYVANIKFHHELASEAAVATKNDKAKTALGATTATTDKAKQEEATLKYLMKLGLVQQIKTEPKKRK